jgi:hypothetical protein
MNLSRRAVRSKIRRVQLGLEELESRLTPAVHGALTSGILTVTADAANDQAAVRVSGTNVLVVDDATHATVLSTAIGNVQGISATGSGLAGQSVSLEGTLALPSGVTANGWTHIQQAGSYNVSTGGYVATASQSIVLTPGAGISTTTKDIDLSANQQNSPSAGNFVGIEVNDATITTAGTGNIDLEARGGNDATTANHYGIFLHNGAVVTSTFVPPPSPPGNLPFDDPRNVPVSPAIVIQQGWIRMNGTGGLGSSADVGVLIEDAHTTLTSLTMQIYINGTGGQSAAGGESGIVVQNGDTLGTVNLNGTGGSGASGNDGIEVNNATLSGSLTGHGGNGNGGGNVGILLTGGAHYLGGSLIGTGGGGSGNGNVGVLMNNGAQARNDNRLIGITGTGGGSGGDMNDGVLLQSNSSVTSSGKGISVQGTAGAGSNSVGLRADQSTALTGYTLEIAANSMSFQANLTATTTATLSPFTPGFGIVLGGSGGAGQLGLSDAELHLVTAATLEIRTDLGQSAFPGFPPPADIVVASPITQQGSGYQKLSLFSGDAIRSTNSASGGAVDISASSLYLQAFDGISLTVNVASLSALNGHLGNITLIDTNRATTLASNGILSTVNDSTISIQTAGFVIVDGPIRNEGNNGTVLLKEVGQPTPTGGADILIDATGTIQAAHVSLQGNANVHGLPGQTAEILAQDLSVISGGQIGSPTSPLVTQIGVLAATGSGGIYVSNNGPLTVGPVGNLGGIVLPAGDIVLSTSGPGNNILNVDGVVQTGSGNVTLVSHRIAVAGSVGGITVYPGSTIRTLWGSVVLSAANGLTLTPGSAVIAVGGPMSLVGGGESAAGGSVVVNGYVGAGQNLLVTGGTGNDTFTLNPMAGSSSVISAVGTSNDSYVIAPSAGTSFYLFGGANAIVVGASAHQPLRHLTQTGSGLSGSITFADFEQIVLDTVGQVMVF